MTEVVTGSRLHFGLINPAAAGSGERLFGGAGMMVDRPGFRLRAVPAGEWSAEGPLAGRALSFARRFVEGVGDVGPQRLVVEAAPPEHAGLGVGTQLGMAVARALASVAGCGNLGAADLARLVGRGLRSGLGVHGFDGGGFLVESGQKTPGTLSPLVARAAVPENWRVVLTLPPGAAAWHGAREQDAFGRLAVSRPNPGAVERLCRLVLLGMLPALAEADLDAFGEAVHEYNARAGEAFAAAQGGTYASAAVAELVAFGRHQGVRGVGQSSWGPTVFAVVASQEEAETLAGEVRRQFDLEGKAVVIAAPLNHGATLSR